uniref:Uncharacterized protein n=1 Tax=Cacopsylla melanoneura TaxID=428564 RepID=A0A8D8XE19_9HEMI
MHCYMVIVLLLWLVFSIGSIHHNIIIFTRTNYLFLFSILGNEKTVKTLSSDVNIHSSLSFFPAVKKIYFLFHKGRHIVSSTPFSLFYSPFSSIFLVAFPDS